MVFDKKRILSGFLLLTFLFLVFFFELNLVLISSLILLTFYDLIFSKIISPGKLIIFNILILSSFFLFYFSNQHPLYLSILFFFFLLLSIIKIKNSFFILTTINLFFYILLLLNNLDKSLIFTLIFISFLNDTVAFIIGKSIGGPLIIPKISPNKTWSGTLSSFLTSYVVLYYLNFNLIECFFIAISLFFGDLFFSYIKRSYSVKDFSNIIPGHGGVLDRIDSIFLSTVLIFIFNFL